MADLRHSHRSVLRRSWDALPGLNCCLYPFAGGMKVIRATNSPGMHSRVSQVYEWVGTLKNLDWSHNMRIKAAHPTGLMWRSSGSWSNIKSTNLLLFVNELWSLLRRWSHYEPNPVSSVMSLDCVGPLQKSPTQRLQCASCCQDSTPVSKRTLLTKHSRQTHYDWVVEFPMNKMEYLSLERNG